MFDNISIIGRAAYGFYALEEYLKEHEMYTAEWDVLFEKLWSFPQFQYVDEYAYMLAECVPDTILEFEDFSGNGDWEYITEEEFLSFRSLYRNCTELQNVSKILNEIEEMLGTHLYAGNLAPAQNSLDIMNVDLLPLLKGLLTQLPPVEPFRIYSVYDSDCWGIFHPREVLLKEIRALSGDALPEGEAVMAEDIVDMEPDVREVQKIIKDNRRFSSPYAEFSGYYVKASSRQTVDGRNEGILQFYLLKLSYASVFADKLIQKAFQPEFYEFYGVDHAKVSSPEKMCEQLVFDSFVLMTGERTINACLSNDTFMFGHYIEYCWDYDWNLLYVNIV